MQQLGTGEYQGLVRGSTAVGGMLITITEYAQRHSTTPLHYHQNAHLSFVLKGLMAVSRKTHSGIHQEIEALSFLRAGEQHQNLLVSTRGKNINLELEPSFFKTFELAESDFDRLTDKVGTSLLMIRLYREIRLDEPGLQDNVHMLLLSLLGAAPTATGNPAWVSIVRSLLNDCWDQPVTLQDIATAAHVHPVTVSKSFSRYFGTTLGQYRRQLKLNRALQLMTNTDMPLTEVAHASGFFDQSHFIRAFKEATGLLPRQYQLL